MPLDFRISAGARNGAHAPRASAFGFGKHRRFVESMGGPGCIHHMGEPAAPGKWDRRTMVKPLVLPLGGQAAPEPVIVRRKCGTGRRRLWINKNQTERQGAGRWEKRSGLGAFSRGLRPTAILRTTGSPASAATDRKDYKKVEVQPSLERTQHFGLRRS